MSERNTDSLEILRFLYKRRKMLISTALISGVMALIYSSIVTPKYESIATVFPPAFNSADRMLENPQFGYNIEADRLIQIGESALIMDSVIELFDLGDYYEIDQNDVDWYGKVNRAYKKDVSFSRTKYMSVEISVLNKDQKMAAEMANKIIEIVSYTWENLFKKKMLETLVFAEKTYFEKQKEVSLLLDSIHGLRNYNKDESVEKLRIQMLNKQKEVELYMNELSKLRESGKFYEIQSQIELISEELIKSNMTIEMAKSKMRSYENSNSKSDTSYSLAKAKYDGAVEHEKFLTQKLNELKSSGKEYDRLSEGLRNSMSHYQGLRQEYENTLNAFEPYVKSINLDYLESRYNSDIQALNDLKRKYELAQRYYYQPLPSLFVIEKARPNYTRKSPSYLINMLIAIGGSLIAVIMISLFKDRYTEIKNSIE